MKILMIINMKSGVKNSKNNLLDAIDVFCKNGYDVTTYVTQKRNDAYEYLMNNKVKYDIVCIFGGDGTMNEVSNALMHKRNKPLLGYFPSGTMNDFSSNFNLDSDFRKLAEKICQKRVHEFDVGQFNDRYFNYVAAFGAMCDVPFTTDRNAKESLGNIAYIIEEYVVNNKTYHGDVLFGLIYSGNRVAGMQLADKKTARIDDGMFNVLIVDYVPTVFEAPDILSTLINQDKYIHTFRTDKISLKFKSKTVFTLDGEEAKVKDHVEIKIHKKALKLLA